MYNELFDPYAILNISPNSSVKECKSAYMELATNPSRIIRRNACLAYDAICNKDKYIIKGNYFRVKNKDCFYYTVVGDLESLKLYTLIISRWHKSLI
jgi:hypothetical protein